MIQMAPVLTDHRNIKFKDNELEYNKAYQVFQQSLVNQIEKELSI